MEHYESCSCAEIEDEIVCLTDVHLPEGVLSAVYIAPAGACGIAQRVDDPGELFLALRNCLATAQVTLYINGRGRYDPYHQTVKELDGGIQAIEAELWELLSQPQVVHSRDKILAMRDKLIYADAQTRGHYRDSDGTVYLLKNGQYRRVSDLDPNQQFLLTAFGGFLGLHRVTMRKYFSAAFYLLTCGLFLLGWLLDILQLLGGFAQDKSKAVILPPQDCKRKLILVIPALILGICVFILYASLVGRFLSIEADPANAGWISEYISSLGGM